MRKLLLLAGCLVLVSVALPKPASAILSCTRFCSGPIGQSCFQQGYDCGQVCDEFGQCTCGCI